MEENLNIVDENLLKLNRSIEELVRLLKEDRKGAYRGRTLRYNPNYEGDYSPDDKNSWRRYYRKPHLSKKWGEMSRQEREDVVEEHQRRKRAAKREEISNELYKSGLGGTKFGRAIESIISKKELADNMASFGKYLTKGGGAKTISSTLFGNGKTAEAATKGLSSFGKGLGSASKLLRGFGVYVTAAIAALDLIGGAVSELLNNLAQAQALGLESSARLAQIAFNQEKETRVANISLQTEGVKYAGDMQMKMLDTQSQIMLNAVKLQTEQYVKGVQTAVGPIMEGINATAYSAAESAIDFSAQFKQNLNLQKTIESQYENFERTRGLEYENQQKITEKNLTLLSKQTEAETLEIGQQIQNDLNRSLYMRQFYTEQELYNNEEIRDLNERYRRAMGFAPIGSTVAQDRYRKSFGEQIQGMDVDEDFWESFTRKQGWFRTSYEDKERLQKDALQYENMIKTNPAEMDAAVTQAQATYALTAQTYTQNILDKLLDIEKAKLDYQIEAGKEIEKTWLKLAQNIEQYIEKFDKVTNDLGISLGYTNKGQLGNYKQTMFSVVEEVGGKFGKDIEELVKFNQGYAETTGRNRIFNKRDYGAAAALGTYLGDDGLATEYASEMEIFNVGVSDSVDMLGEALNDVNRMGLNGRKYTKTLIENLKLAQRYNFKGGTENLMQMSKWAENTRFNMSSLGGMLDKISEGGLEGIITQGAQFQVLGGHAAMNADPLAMMFERYSDPEALMRRYQDMTRGYGQLDRVTGETKFTGPEQMLMEQLAKIQGRSTEELMNEVRARNKKEVVSKQLGDIFDEEEMSFISNNATYDKKTGTFKVKVKNGDDYEEVDVGSLTRNDIDKLMPEEHNARMEDYMLTVISLEKQMIGEQTRETANLASANYQEVVKAYEDRIILASKNYAEHKEDFVKQVQEGVNLATNSFDSFIKIFNDRNPQVEAQVKGIATSANAIVTALQSTAEIIAIANAKISAASPSNGGLTYSAFHVSPPNSALLGQGGSEPTPANTTRRTGQIRSDGMGYGGLDYSNLDGEADDAVYSGAPLLLSRDAGSITPLTMHDGLVQTDPNDVAIFAKEGGVIGNFLASLYDDVHSLMGRTIQADEIKVVISGNLDLSSGGQSINIINELQNNPMLLRSLSRMLSQHISSAMNGGRGTANLAIGSV